VPLGGTLHENFPVASGPLSLQLKLMRQQPTFCDSLTQNVCLGAEVCGCQVIDTLSLILRANRYHHMLPSWNCCVYLAPGRVTGESSPICASRSRDCLMSGTREAAADCLAFTTNLCCCRYFAEGLAFGSYSHTIQPSYSTSLALHRRCAGWDIAPHRHSWGFRFPPSPKQCGDYLTQVVSTRLSYPCCRTL
jgi:hypothetical protein